MSGIQERRNRARSEPGPGYASKRDALLRAAASVFTARGFDAASINDIAGASGMDRATIYYYFTDKHEIFAAVIEDVVKANVDAGERIAGSDATATEKIRQLIAALLESYETHYPYLFVWLQEDVARLEADGPSNSQILRDMGRRYHFAVENTIREGIDSGEFRASLDPRRAAYFLLGALNWTHRWFEPGKYVSASELAADFADYALHGFVAKPVRRRKS